jgi:hypothetical protein
MTNEIKVWGRVIYPGNVKELWGFTVSGEGVHHLKSSDGSYENFIFIKDGKYSEGSTEKEAIEMFSEYSYPFEQNIIHLD